LEQGGNQVEKGQMGRKRSRLSEKDQVNLAKKYAGLTDCALNKTDTGCSTVHGIETG